MNPDNKPTARQPRHGMGTPLGRGRRPISSIAWEGTREERGSTLVDDRIAPAPAPGARIVGFDAVRNLRDHDAVGRAELGRYLGLADNRLRQHAPSAHANRRPPHSDLDALLAL